MLGQQCLLCSSEKKHIGIWAVNVLKAVWAVRLKKIREKAAKQKETLKKSERKKGGHEYFLAC